jgi:hypothetical protein
VATEVKDHAFDPELGAGCHRGFERARRPVKVGHVGRSEINQVNAMHEDRDVAFCGVTLAEELGYVRLHFATSPLLRRREEYLHGFGANG